MFQTLAYSPVDYQIPAMQVQQHFYCNSMMTPVCFSGDASQFNSCNNAIFSERAYQYDEELDQQIDEVATA